MAATELYQGTIAQLLAQADIWEDLGDGKYYIGYAALGTEGTDEETFAICHVDSPSEGVFTRKWAGGTRDKNFAWDDRGDYDYSFLL